MHTMKIVAFAAASALAGVASAEPSHAPATGPSIQIKGAAAGNQFAIFDGHYQLADGRVLRMSADKQRYYAQFDRKRKIEVVPTGETSFAGAATPIELRFDAGGGGRVAVVAPR